GAAVPLVRVPPGRGSFPARGFPARQRPVSRARGAATLEVMFLCRSPKLYGSGLKGLVFFFPLPRSWEGLGFFSPATLVGTKIHFPSFRCETCSEEEAKYRCPRCMKYSCSLLCVKKHKLALSCNGIRDKTAFVSVNEFTDLNLLSDYRFLEDVGRTADAAARDLSVHRPTTNKFINYLRNRARRHNIILKTLPIGFTKRRENSTIFNKKEQKFYWHLKLMFPHCHAEYTLKRVPEDKTLTDILKPYIDPVESDPVVCQRLKIYTMSPQSDVQILMKIENRRQNSTRYNELDASRSLLDNLKDKVIIEYPTLFVVLKTLKNDMVVLGQVASEKSSRLGKISYNKPTVHKRE
uniref:Box C/D snoRNA protein 1 n=2 Tax=Dromaius novaehollandiae TaxID=8790 RepID=A0A8C4K5X3_DRONO